MDDMLEELKEKHKRQVVAAELENSWSGSHHLRRESWRDPWGYDSVVQLSSCETTLLKSFPLAIVFEP